MSQHVTDWPALTQALARTMHEHAPGWTDRNDSDPGITMLELIAYVAEGVSLYQGRVPLNSVALRAITAIEAATRDERSEHWSGTKRIRFFAGRLLTAGDLTEEQEYHLAQHRRHLRTLHGSGVAGGLAVSVATDGQSIAIAPGLAIDGYGREICLDRQTAVTIPADAESPSWLVIEYAERRVDPVPVSTGGSTEASRIEEGCAIAVSKSCERGVAVARLMREETGWRIDPSFTANRLRPIG